jgi:hypothetical protein
MRFLVDLFVRILFISVDIMCFVFVSKLKQDDEDSELAPSTSQSGNYEFNNQPTQAPEGGFSF